ncbi:MAG: hypothetical protein ABUJ92_02550 [Desulfobacterales bacterium]
MKAFKLGLVVMAAALISLALGAPAMAFHDDGVADCAGCHTMHNSQDGAAVTPTPGDHLLIMSDPSSTCLECHAAYGQMTTDGSSRGSGGDFYWLTKTYTWSAHGHASSSEGDSHGHNIIAGDFGLPLPDAVLGTIAPGGGDVGELACSSCHDPHGKGEGPLLLWGTEKIDFSADAPVLKGLSRRTTVPTGTSQGGYVANDNHVAYGSGMSDWCANCHTDFLIGDQMHPVDEQMGSTYAGNYNDYVSTGVMTGDQATARWEAVPFETNQSQADLDADPDANSTEVGPTASSKVMCLSCHRAHATAFQDIGRWDFNAAFIVEDSHPTLAEEPNSYYGVAYVPGDDVDFSQRSLCNKCHVQD